MKVFLDTHVLIDILDNTRPTFAASTKILDAAEDGRLEVVVTGLSLVNMVYTMRRLGASKKLLGEFIQTLLNVATIASTDIEQLRAAAVSGWNDFEDAVQYQAALSSGKVQAIITSDGKGFKGSRIPVFTPDEFVAEHL